MRIAIVNDMEMAVELLKNILIRIPDYEIAWIAYHGKEAVEKCSNDVPDIILMDLIMPVMGGVEATEHIMKNNPCPILIVTSDITTNASKVFDAMGFGALDVVRTPVLAERGKNPVGEEDLIRKIEMIAYLTGKNPKKIKRTLSNKREEGKIIHGKKPPLIVLGASTGGPYALSKILHQIPLDCPAAVVIIQHVDENFALGLAQWLEKQISRPVQLAKAGAVPAANSVYMAGKNLHLILNEKGEFAYTAHPLEEIYIPSVDVFFMSVAQNWNEKSAAALLTGMGNDGAQGLKALQDEGWYTIAQDEESCVVYGMPRAAVQLGAADAILPLEKIGTALVSHLFQNVKA